MRTLIRLLLIIVATGASVALLGAALAPTSANGITELVDTSDPGGALLFLGLFVLGGVVAIPPAIFTAAAGVLWPFPVAVAIAFTGGMVTALLGFLISRHVARDICARYIPVRFRRYYDQVEQDGLKTTIVIRLLFFLFPPVNWMLGISCVRLRDYLLGTAIGCLPGMVLYTHIGNDWIPWFLQEPVAHIVTAAIVIGALMSGLFVVRSSVRKRRGDNDQGPSISLRLFLRSAWYFMVLSVETFFPPGPYSRPPPLKRCVIMGLFLPAFAVLQMIHWAALFLDEIFFPGYRSVEVKKPCFIVGIPRSGTTYLHRVLAGDTDQFTTLQLWHVLLAPAICERKFLQAIAGLDRALGRPMGRLVTTISDRLTGDLSDIHRLSLDQPEEDFVLLLPVLACFILTAAFPHAKGISDLARFDSCIPREQRRDIMAFYRGMLQRHLYCAGANRILLSKNVSFTPMLLSLLEVFPDANVVACIRDPVHTVPSQISSMEQGWLAFGNNINSALFRDRWIELIEHYCGHLGSLLGSPAGERVECVDMNRIMNDLGGTVRAIYERFGLHLNTAFEERLADEAQAAVRYSSRHEYSLKDYELDATQLSNRFRNLWKQLQQYAQPGTTP